jgi:hypothetical protein
MLISEPERFLHRSAPLEKNERKGFWKWRALRKLFRVCFGTEYCICYEIQKVMVRIEWQSG